MTLSAEEDEEVDILEDEGDEEDVWEALQGSALGRMSAGSRSYQRPWTAGAQRRQADEPELRYAAPSRQRPASAKPAMAHSGTAARAGKRERVHKEQREKRKEQGWDGRFGVSRDVNTYDAKRKAGKKGRAPLTYSLGKEVKNKSNTKGLHGKLLPWLDPKKQIKRKPLVDGAPVIMRRNIY